MRCCQAVRWSTRVLRSRTVVRRSKIHPGGIHEQGSRPCSSSSRSSRASVRSVLARRLGPRRLLEQGRLGQVRDQPGRLELLGHKPPAGASLHRERALGPGQLAQPGTQARPGRRRDPTPVGLAAVTIHPVEGDLPSVHVQPTYDACSTIIRA